MNFAPDDRIEVACPNCGEIYNLASASVGTWFRCRSDQCRKAFQVEQPGNGPPNVVAAEPLDETEIAEAEIVSAEPAGGGEPTSQPASSSADPIEVVRGVAVEPQPQPQPPATPEVPTLPAAAIVSQAAPPVLPGARPAGLELGGAPRGTVDDSVPVLPATAVVATHEKPHATDWPPSTGDPASPEAQERSAPVAKQGNKRERNRPKKELSAREQRQRNLRWVSAVLAVLMLAGIVAALAFRPERGPNPDWDRCVEHYQQEKWRRAKQAFEKFAEDYPDEPRTARVPFFVDMCDAGADIWSLNGDPVAGLHQAQKIFQEHRDNEAYHGYTEDFYLAVAHLTQRFIAGADQLTTRFESTSAEKLIDENELPQSKQRLEEASGQLATAEGQLASAMSAHGLLSTIARAITEPWAAERVGELADKIAQLQGRIEQSRQRIDVLAQIHQVLAGEVRPSQLDDAYRDINDILQRTVELRGDTALINLLSKAQCREADLVTYEPVKAQLAAQHVNLPAAANPGRSIFVVWGDTSDGPAAAGNREVYFALARGVMYAFDQNGRALWVKRLGIDSHRLPVMVDATAHSPRTAIAVSTNDNSLVALSVETGNELWRYEVDLEQNLAAPLTIVSVKPDPNSRPRTRGFLPTADGQIHVLDLALGRRIGRYQVGQPLTQPGTYDPATELVYFAADSNRVFAIDPRAVDRQQSDHACPALLMTQHAAGSLRGPPSVVGPYLIVAEASQLAEMRVRVFKISPTQGIFADAAAPPLQQVTLQGWSWFRPSQIPDRLAVMTDQGQLGLFGLNLDYAEEALYPIIEGPDGDYPQLPISDHFRTLLVHSHEHLAWVMAGGEFRKLALDVIQQKVTQVWPRAGQPAPVNGIPLHEAQSDRWQSTFYLATSSLQGERVEFSAVDADQGGLLWRRQLGAHVLRDPIALGGDVLLVDRSGRMLVMPAGEKRQGISGDLLKRARYAQSPETTNPAMRDGAGALKVIDGGKDKIYLSVLQDEGRSISLKRIDLKRAVESPWIERELEGRVMGRVAIQDDILVAACNDGRLYRMPLLGRSANQLPFQWVDPGEVPSPDDRVDTYAMPNGMVLLVEESSNGFPKFPNFKSRLRRFRSVVRDEIVQWEPQGLPHFLPNELIGPPIFVDDVVCVADTDNTIMFLSLDNEDARPRKTKLEEEITTEPFNRGRFVFAVEGERRLTCLVPDKGVNWRFGPFFGDIAGKPVMRDGLLIVADRSGRVTAVRPEDGQQVWQVNLGRGKNPSAAAVPYGDDRILVPLIDGSFIEFPIPREETDATDQEAA